MLKKKNRLSRREFAHLLKYGRRLHGEGVTIVFEKVSAYSLQLTGTPPESCKLKTESSPALRAGVVVGKKVARNAVDRNKLRRVIYGILGEVLSPSESLHLAILTRPKARMMTPEELRREIVTLLARCGEGNEKSKTQSAK